MKKNGVSLVFQNNLITFAEDIRNVKNNDYVLDT